MEQVTLKNLNKPTKKNLEDDIDWICDSFNFSSGRDTDYVINKVMNALMERWSKNPEISSEAIADDLDISQGMANHHIRNLIKCGIVYRHKKKLVLRGGSLRAAIDEIRKDTERVFEHMESIAEDIDDKLGLKSR